MRDVSSKSGSLRSAKASATLKVSSSTIRAVKTGDVPKADPLGVAKIAGIQSAKNTSLLIPYCHQVPLDYVAIDFKLMKDSIIVNAEVKAIWKTGVEMEALVAASSAVLTLYDMLKIIDERMEVVNVQLTEKKGGKSAIRVTGKGLTASVIVLSDSVSRGVSTDRSGKMLKESLTALGFKVHNVIVLPDDQDKIVDALKTLADRKNIDLIVTTGGTGIGPRDVTPEATLAVIHRRIEGVEEALRNFGQERMPMAMLSRCVVGVRDKTLIINLPGSTGGVQDGMNAIFPSIIHTFRMLKGEKH